MCVCALVRWFLKGRGGGKEKLFVSNLQPALPLKAPSPLIPLKAPVEFVEARKTAGKLPSFQRDSPLPVQTSRLSLIQGVAAAAAANCQESHYDKSS